MKTKEKYIAFLRGINVGGHHKIPMADLKIEMQKLGYENVITLLNSGNIIFEADSEPASDIEKRIAAHLEKTFGFPVPSIVVKSEMIVVMLNENPFKGVKLTKDIRLYASFLRKNNNARFQAPWKSVDNSYEIICKSDQTILSVLDVSISKTPKAMEALEKFFGKDITTRNWNTIERIGKVLEQAD